MSSISTTKDNEAERLSELSVNGQTLSLDCYDNLNNISSLQSEWQLLEKCCKEDFTFFQSYNWCIEYYKQFASDQNNRHSPLPQVFILRDENRPVMIWPMMQIQSRTGLKILTTATEPLGQYCNLIFDDSIFDEKIGQAVLKLIIENSKSDSVSLNNYTAGGMIDSIIGDQGIKENSNLESAILNLSHYENWEAHTQTLSKAQRKDRKRNKNKLEAQGEISYEVHPAGTTEYKTLVSLALTMKTKWLLETGRKPGILAEDATKAMLTNLQPALSDMKNGPVVHSLNLNKTPIAIEIGMINAERYYSYLGAIDWAWKDFGPGKLQMAMSQEWAMQRGIKNYDLLHDPSEYKSSWSNQSQRVLSRNIAITYKGYIYSKLWKTYIRPKIKTIYHFAGSKNRDRLNKIVDIFRK